MTNQETKSYSQCGALKPISEFYKGESYKDGYRGVCNARTRARCRQLVRHVDRTKKLIFLLYSILLVTFHFNMLPVFAPLTDGQVHNIDTGLDYTTIQEAIDAPETLAQHTIQVDSGIYYEHLNIYKSLTLVGEDKSSTIVDGSGIRSVIIVTTKNVTITGFTMQNSGPVNELQQSAGLWIGNLTQYDKTNNLNITNNNIISNLGWGIWLSYSTNNIISGNNIAKNNEGIGIEYSSSNTISDNNITNNGIGIRSWYSSSNTISDNNITNNHYGIKLYSSSSNTMSDNNITNTTNNGIDIIDSSNNTLRRNDIRNNNRNISVHGRLLSSYIHDIDDSNTVNDRPIYYWVNKEDKVVPPNAGWVALIYCTRISIEHLSISNQYQGVLLAFTTDSLIATNILRNNTYDIMLHKSSNNTIFENQITESCDGIYLRYYSSNNNIFRNNITDNSDGISIQDDSSNNIIAGNNIAKNNGAGINFGRSVQNNTISENIIINNTYYGLYIWDSSDSNSIFGNSVSNSNRGIWVSDSSNNIIYHNNFFNNNEQVYISQSTNVWDNGYPSGGNYWSDYMGVDLFSGVGQDILGSDGIGDTPYVLDASNQDNYPLMQKFPVVEYCLIVSVSGSGTTSPSAGTHSYVEDTEVDVSAFPASGWSFSHWLLDSANVGDTNPYTVTMNTDQTLTAIFTEDTQEPPVANFTYSPLDPQVNDTITFDASGCSDADGTIVSYLWDFGDGDSSTIQNPTHAYSQEGSYTVTLTVTDNDGLTGTATAGISDVVVSEFSSYILMLTALTLIAVIGMIYKKKQKF